MFELKPLSHERHPAALAKAERYRLLNEPAQAESICHDILAVEPDNQRRAGDADAGADGPIPDTATASWCARAQSLVARLDTAYERAYFGGLVAERRARAILVARMAPAGLDLGR